MGIEYISGSDNFGFPLGKEPEIPLSEDDYYIAGGLGIAGDEIIFQRVRAKQHIKAVSCDDLKPILGLGIRKAFLKAFKAIGAAFNDVNIHSINTRKDIKTLTELEKSMVENKSGAAVLGVAGMALAGPIGILAAFAAKKKGEVVFAIEFKATCKDPLLNGKTIVLSSPLQEFEKLKKKSSAPSKSTQNFISQQKEGKGQGVDSVASDIEKLVKLKKSGAISEEEFSAAKAKLLGIK